MLAIARYSLKGKSQAILVLTVCTILAWVVPFVSCISTAILLLICLRQSVKEVLNVLVLSLLAIIVFIALLQAEYLEAAMITLAFWAPAILIAEVMRKTGSMSLAIVSTAVLSSVIVLALFAVFPEPPALWVDKLEATLDHESIQNRLAVSPEQADNVIYNFAKLMMVSLGLGVTINAVLGLLLAFWWQGKLYPPPVLQAQFHRLRFGKVLSISTLLLFLLAILTGIEWLVALMLVWLMIFIFQGLAVVHNLALKQEWDNTWLMMMYATIVILPLFMLGILVFVGLGDSWTDFRSRAKS